MLRIVLLEAALLILPFVAYGIYLRLARGGFIGKDFLKGPILWLLAAGLVMVAASLAILAAFTGSPPDAVYVPPRYENGVLIPGHVEPRQPDGRRP